MDSFDAWIGCVVRCAATAALAGALVLLLSCATWVFLDSAWKRMSLAARLAWVHLVRRRDRDALTREIELRIQLEREKQERERSNG